MRSEETDNFWGFGKSKLFCVHFITSIASVLRVFVLSAIRKCWLVYHYTVHTWYVPSFPYLRNRTKALFRAFSQQSTLAWKSSKNVGSSRFVWLEQQPLYRRRRDPRALRSFVRCTARTPPFTHYTHKPSRPSAVKSRHPRTHTRKREREIRSFCCPFIKDGLRSGDTRRRRRM